LFFLCHSIYIYLKVKIYYKKKALLPTCIYKSRAEVQTFGFCISIELSEVNEHLSFKALS